MNFKDSNIDFFKNPLWQFLGISKSLLILSIIVFTSWYCNSTLYVIPALILVYFIITISYLFWSERFIPNIKTRCPQCQEFMKTICCASCKHQVPFLALWMNGLFLSHCPHCGQKVINKKGTLLANCNNYHTQKNPAVLYKKPTLLTVYVVATLPKHESIGKWKFLKKIDKYKMVYYYEEVGDTHSANLLYILKENYFDDSPDPEREGFTWTNLLIISNKVDNLRKDIIKGYFPDKNLTQIIDGHDF